MAAAAAAAARHSFGSARAVRRISAAAGGATGMLRNRAAKGTGTGTGIFGRHAGSGSTKGGNAHAGTGWNANGTVTGGGKTTGGGGRATGNGIANSTTGTTGGGGGGAAGHGGGQAAADGTASPAARIGNGPASPPPTCGGCTDQLHRIRAETMAENNRLWDYHNVLQSADSDIGEEVAKLETTIKMNKAMAKASVTRTSYAILLSTGGFLFAITAAVGPVVKNAWEAHVVSTMETRLLAKAAPAAPAPPAASPAAAPDAAPPAASPAPATPAPASSA